MELKGKIIAALPEQGGTSKAGNAWRKRDYVLETQETYPKKMCFNLFGDRIDQYPMAVGDEVVVSFDIDSHEYNGRWYNDIRAFKIDRVAPGAATAAAPATHASTIPGDFPPAPADLPAAGPTEDLPF
ncbi:MAG: DUF3127 domain-containing protein [Bacteroides sp.]|nr:DUF3127 domain-containing protein [Bacteroides sp.]MCM1379723.1 DUF3127 domain-containing protein [Bacteroides sp.]MCM1446078.1 DUF3127 domain-containing protein [Prevotella sp.]